MLTAELFESIDDEDRGGVVIRIKLPQTESGDYIPYARLIPDGIEIHMAGDSEGHALVEALRQLFKEVAPWTCPADKLDNERWEPEPEE